MQLEVTCVARDWQVGPPLPNCSSSLGCAGIAHCSMPPLPCYFEMHFFHIKKMQFFPYMSVSMRVLFLFNNVTYQQKQLSMSV
jgi:hypothetical protein